MKKLQLIFSITIASISFSQVPNYVPTNGLVGWWPFTGNANDESGNGNNGTVNGATLTTDRNGIANSAYSFDGISNSIEVSHQPIFNMGNNYTISAWFNLIDFNAVRTIINKNITGEGKNDYFNLSVLNNSGIIYLQFGNGVSVDTIGTTFPISLNTWHNTQMVMGDSVSLYLDGVLIGKKIRALDPMENIDPMSIGHWINQNIFFSGKLDDLAIWNRALNQCEITNLYNSQLGSSNTSSTITQTALDSYTLNGQTYTQSGTYTQVIPNAAGCDSTITLDLTLDFTGIIELNGSILTLSPNPTSSKISLKSSLELIGKEFNIYDQLGKAVKSGIITSEETEIDLSFLTEGIYLFKVGAEMKESFKIIKQ
jgi:hypothetical protein